MAVDPNNPTTWGEAPDTGPKGQEADPTFGESIGDAFSYMSNRVANAIRNNPLAYYVGQTGDPMSGLQPAAVTDPGAFQGYDKYKSSGPGEMAKPPGILGDVAGHVAALGEEFAGPFGLLNAAMPGSSILASQAGEGAADAGMGPLGQSIARGVAGLGPGLAKALADKAFYAPEAIAQRLGGASQTYDDLRNAASEAFASSGAQNIPKDAMDFLYKLSSSATSKDFLANAANRLGQLRDYAPKLADKIGATVATQAKAFGANLWNDLSDADKAAIVPAKQERAALERTFSEASDVTDAGARLVANLAGVGITHTLSGITGLHIPEVGEWIAGQTTAALGPPIARGIRRFVGSAPRSSWLRLGQGPLQAVEPWYEGKYDDRENQLNRQNP